MKSNRMAALAVGCAGALALTAPALGAKGDTVKTGTYTGSALKLKVSKKSMSPSEVDQPVVKGECRISNTGERSQTTFNIPAMKFKGKRPKIGVKSFREIHTESKNPRGLAETTDYKLTVKFSTANRAKVKVEYKSKSTGNLGSTTCSGKAGDTISRK